MTYNPGIVSNTPWGTAKYPSGVSYSIRIKIHSARLLARASKRYDAMTGREVWDRNTTMGIDYAGRTMDRWLAYCGKSLKYFQKQVKRLQRYNTTRARQQASQMTDIATWVATIIAEAENVMASTPDYQRARISVDCTWQNAGSWQKAKITSINTTPHIDVLDIRRRDNGKVMRLATDGDNAHLGRLAINGEVYILNERGWRGTVYYGRSFVDADPPN